MSIPDFWRLIVYTFCMQAIDKLPLIPGVLEFIGTLFSSVSSVYVCIGHWCTYTPTEV